MKNQIKKIIKTSKHKLIKVRLDYKTVITLSRMSSLAVWLIRYPDAKLINS